MTGASSSESEEMSGGVRRAGDGQRSHVASPATLRVEAWRDGAAWDGFVESASDGTIMHRWGWKHVIERSCGHRTIFLAAVEDRDVRGVLPLVVIKSLLFGRHVVSMPFVDYGGLCTGGDERAGRLLLEAAKKLADEERAVLELRQYGERDIDLPRSLEKVTMLLDLGTDEEALWKRLPSNRRGQVRKGQRNGLTVSIHGVDAIPDFYRVLSTNMRDLGSPEHGPGFFRLIMEAFGERAQIMLVRSENQAVGAGLLLLDRERISVPWSSSLRSAFRLGANQVLYWEAMRRGIASGVSVFDFGRSSRDSGTFESKREWGAKPVQLAWYHYPENSEPSHEAVQGFSWAVKMWQRLPVSVANAVGSRLRKSIPN